MRFLAVPFTLLASAGLAVAAPQSDMSVPVAAGAPHMCFDKEGAQWARLTVGRGEYGTRTMQFKFRVTTEGTVSGLVVAQSSDDADADRLAMACVAKWRYRPAQKDGQPVEMDWMADVSFQIGDGAIPKGKDFDDPASRSAGQQCRVLPAQQIEKNWSSTNSGGYMHAAGANDGFECTAGSNGMRLCRAKPGSALYPTNVLVTPLSTAAGSS